MHLLFHGHKSDQTTSGRAVTCHDGDFIITALFNLGTFCVASVMFVSNLLLQTEIFNLNEYWLNKV